MRQKRQKKDQSFQPIFRNTKSRLYKRKSSFHPEQPDYSNPADNSSQNWKQRGNDQFKLGRFDKAIECYSKAIEINPGQSQFYSNRSKCYQKKGMLGNCLKDAETACELEDDNIKAHYICGCVLAELGKTDWSKLIKSQNRLKKALRLCRTKNVRQFEEQISIKLFRFKKLMYFRDQEKQLQELFLQKKSMNRCLQRKEISQQQHRNITQRIQNRIRQIKQPKQIPDYLICKITLMLMEDPVLSQEGFTYERNFLEEHYQLKGPIEPITRKQVKGHILPNHALKQAIESFLKQNPWAFEEQKGQNYKNIVFI